MKKQKTDEFSWASAVKILPKFSNMIYFLKEENEVSLLVVARKYANNVMLIIIHNGRKY